MMPAVRHFDIKRGDDQRFVFKFFETINGVTGPHDASDSVFELKLSNGTMLLSSVLDDSLYRYIGSDGTSVVWAPSPAETGRIALGTFTTYDFTRIRDGKRTTYLTGFMRGVDAPKTGHTDTAIAITIDAGDIVTAITVDDSVAPQIADKLIALVAADREAIEAVGTAVETAAQQTDGDAQAAEAARVASAASATASGQSAGAASGSAAAAAADRDTVASNKALVDVSAAQSNINATAAAAASALALNYRDSAMAAASNQTAFYETKPALDLNTTAVVGVVKSGPDVGTYERSTPNNPATPWVKASPSNVFTLAARAQKVEGYTRRFATDHDWPRRIPSDASIIRADRSGVIHTYIDTGGGAHFAPASGATTFSASDISTGNTAASFYTAGVLNSALPVELQDVLLSGVSQIVVAGQSLSADAQMFGDFGPMIPVGGLFQIGQSTRPDETNTKRFLSSGGAHVVGSVSGASFIVTSLEGDGLVKVGAALIGTGVAAGTTIIAGPAGGGVGTYTLSNASMTLASRDFITRNTRDDRFLPARPTVRFYEETTNVLLGNMSLGSPPMSENPASPYWRRLLNYDRANLGGDTGYFAVRAWKQTRNRRANRPDSYSLERIVITNAGVGATSVHEWRRFTSADDHDNTKVYGTRGERVRVPGSLYGAATLIAAGSTGNPPPAPGEGESNAYWSIGTDCFNRIEEAMTLVKGISQTAEPGVETCAYACVYFQGTNNASRLGKADYATGMANFIASYRFVEQSIHGQKKPGAIFIYSEQVNLCGFRPFMSTYSAGTTYAAGDIVDSGLFIWLSLQGSNLNHAPGVSPTYWVRLKDWATWVADKSFDMYDLTTFGDRGFYSKTSNNLAHPPVVNGVVDTVNWVEVLGDWSGGAIEVDDAKLDLAKTEPTVFHIGAGYSAWHKRRVHGSANWCKHMGLFLEQAMTQVLTDKRRWLPLHCYKATVRDREIFLEWFVPKGGLRFKPVYRDYNLVMLPHKGIGIFDGTAPLPNNGVPTGNNNFYLPSTGLDIYSYSPEIVGTHTMRIVAPRTLTGDVWVTFGDPGRSYSMTNIFDGAGWGAADTYAYSTSQNGVAAFDMHPAEASLKDQPFDMSNPCVPHSIKCIRA